MKQRSEEFMKIAELVEDEYILSMIEEREKNDGGTRYSHDEILRILDEREKSL